MDLTDFYVNSITPPDEVLARIDERASMGALGDLGAYTRFKAAVALGDAAKGGGARGATPRRAGMGVGLGAGFGVQMAGAPWPTRCGPPAAAGGGAAAAAAGGFCARCGGALPAGRASAPAAARRGVSAVPSAAAVPAGARFCPGCGAPPGPAPAGVCARECCQQRPC